MPHNPSKITHIEAALIDQRIGSLEKRVDGQQMQFTDLISKIAVFEAALKTQGEESRRSNELQARAMQELREAYENHTNAIFKHLNTITDALGLDGTPAKAEMLRENLKKLHRSNRFWGEAREDFLKKVITNFGYWALAFAIGAILLRLGFNINIFAL